MRLISKEIFRRGSRLIPALALLGAALPIACSGDDDDAADTDGDDAADDGSAGAGGVEKPRWIVGGWLSTDDAYTGYLTVVEDISDSSSIDLSQVIEFPGDIVWQATEDGVVYVGQEAQPTIERWVVKDGQTLEKDGEVSLANFGVTSTLGGGRNVIQLVDADTAYYFDNENFQVVVFDPEKMTTVDSFSIAGLDEEGQWPGLNFIHHDGDRFIVTARYWSLEDDTATHLVRAAFIDSTDNSVSYADDTRCGEVAFNATDDAGNLYLGSHQGNAVSLAAGIAGDNPSDSCILRIRKGATEFDADYYVDLAEVSNGGIVGGLLQGPGSTAYVYSYAGEPITAENYRRALRAEDWELYAIDLDNEEGSYTKVEGLTKYAPYGDSFSTAVDGKDVPYVTLVDADFSAGQYFDVSAGTKATAGLPFPGFPGHATALR